MKVVWTDNAIAHIQAIHDYIAQSSTAYAKRIVDQLTIRSVQIATFPLSGRTVPEWEFEQIREVIEGRYRIIYYIKPNQIDVLAVIHDARNVFDTNI